MIPVRKIVNPLRATPRLNDEPWKEAEPDTNSFPGVDIEGKEKHDLLTAGCSVQEIEQMIDYRTALLWALVSKQKAKDQGGCEHDVVPINRLHRTNRFKYSVKERADRAIQFLRDKEILYGKEFRVQTGGHPAVVQILNPNMIPPAVSTTKLQSQWLDELTAKAKERKAREEALQPKPESEHYRVLCDFVVVIESVRRTFNAGEIINDVYTIENLLRQVPGKIAPVTKCGLIRCPHCDNLVDPDPDPEPARKKGPTVLEVASFNLAAGKPIFS